MIFLPHIFFSCLYNFYPSVWKARVLPSQSALEKYWSTMQHTSAMKFFRKNMTSNWASFTIPLALHGDAVPVVGVGKNWQKSKLYWSWQSLVGSGTVMQTMFYICGIWKHVLAEAEGNDTRDQCYKISAWSFRWLAKTVHSDLHMTLFMNFAHMLCI